MKRLTLVQRFSLLCLGTLVCFGVGFGWVVTSVLEHNMVARSEQLTASFVIDEVKKEFSEDDFTVPKSNSNYDAFSETVQHINFGPGVIRIKIWNKDHTVVWSDEKQIVGERFPDNEELKQALEGEIVSEITALAKPEHAFEHKFGRLLEQYIPIKFDNEGDVEAVVEIYKDLDPLYTDILLQKKIVWSGTALGITGFFLVFFGIVRNASRRIEAQTEEIKESEERYRSLIQSAQDGIISVDNSGKVILLNEAAAQIFGYSVEEIIGNYLTMLMPEQYREGHQAGMRRFSETGQSAVTGKTLEVEGLRKDGRAFPLELSISVSGEKSKQVITGILRDISERKAMQEQLITVSEALRVELKKEKETALMLLQAAKMAAIGELAGNIAHEVNNPIGIILGKAKLLLSDFKDQVPARVARDLEKIDRHAERVAGIVRGLLSFSRPSTQEKESIEIGAVIEDSLSLVDARLRADNIVVKVSLAERLPRIVGNFNDLQQVIINLANNAADAMPGGGELSISARPFANRMNERTVEGVEVKVSDTGKGISSDNIERVFTPFFTTKEAEGTGLGLAIVQGIIKDHGGKIGVESVVGKRTTFKIFLPGGEE